MSYSSLAQIGWISYMRMNAEYLINRRQFIIMNQVYKGDVYKSLELETGIYLSYHKDLNVLRVDKGFLIGTAFSANEKYSISDVCAASLQYFGGRFVYIENRTLYLDACGSLGIYYIKNNGDFIISSSLNLIKDVTGIKWHADYYAEHGKGGILDYYPIPYTPYPGVRKLLPTQILTLNGNVLFRRDYMIPRYADVEVDRLRSAFISGMACEMRNISKVYGENVWISLTGGYDSRTNFAIAKYSGIQFHAYTALRKSLNPVDLKRAKQICRKYGLTHEVIDDRKVTEDALYREELFERHVGGHITFGTEKRQFIANSDVKNASEAIVLWGTMWAMTYRAYAGFMKETKTVEETIEEIGHWANEQMLKSTIHRSSIGEWVRFVYENPVDGMDWRQRLYWEQRNGSWVSAAQQGIDLMDSLRISPINCQYLIELLLSYPDKYQYEKIKQKEIIDICCPELKNIPYGESSTSLIMQKVKSKIERIVVRDR